MSLHEENNYANWIDHQNKEMIDLVVSWGNICSSSDYLEGLSQMLNALKKAFLPFEATVQELHLPLYPKINQEGKTVFFPLGKALHLRKRPQAPNQILLAGHMDTVFGPNDPFKKVEKCNTNLLKGPGVADMKGGLVILLKALEAFERTPYADSLGWQILINPDEEIGSPGSSKYFVKIAHQTHLSLLFEPSLIGGEFASFRKGSANYAVVATGKAAHVGRDPEKGKSAINALAHFITFIETLSHPQTGIFINVGSFHGGIANNIVPPLATCHFNMRYNDQAQMERIEEKMHSYLRAISLEKKVDLTLYPIIHRPPKTFDLKTMQCFQLLKECGSHIGIDIKWHGTAGVCDGNILSAEGLPCIDTCGARGGNLHTSDEFIYIDSLSERAKLITLFLMKVAQGELATLRSNATHP